MSESVEPLVLVVSRGVTGVPCRGFFRVLNCLNTSSSAPFLSLAHNLASLNSYLYVQVCGFLNNVEGNWDYFKRYIDESAILAWDEVAEHLPVTKEKRLKFKNDDALFVFGGNSQVMICTPSISFSLSRALEYLSQVF